MPKKRVSLSIDVPRITEQGRTAAQRIAGAAFQLGDDSTENSVAASELHEEDVRREARRVASINNVTERESAIFQMMTAHTELVRAAQILATEYLRTADGLDRLSSQIGAAEMLTTIDRVTRLDDHPP